VLGRGEEEHLVARLDHRVAVRVDRALAAEDRDDPRVDVRDVLLDLADRLADQQAVAVRADGDQADRAVGELEHLQRLGELDELGDVVGDGLLGDDQVVDRERALADQLGVVLEVGAAHARDPRRDVEHLRGEVAGDEVGLVALRRRDQHVGVVGARVAQHRGLRGVAGDGAQVEPVLQLGEARRVGVDDGDVVLFRDEALGDRRADPSGAQDDDLHAAGAPEGTEVTARSGCPCGTRPSTGRCRAA
jgi:hypothetical protein